MDPATTPVSPPALKVLTLNCWGLKFVAQQRRQRILAIADWIGNSRSARPRTGSYHSDDSEELLGHSEGGGAYDVVALQEIWVEEDFRTIAVEAKRAGLLHSRFFYSGAIGSGLGFLSSRPISTSFIFPYPLCGHPLHFIEGDFFAAKGVAGICIDVEGVGKVDVLNTHMYAPGGEGEHVDGAHRAAQAWELARIVQEKVERGRHVILMGDLNSQPHSIIIRLLTSHGHLSDAFSSTHPRPPPLTSETHHSLSRLEAIHIHGITCDSPLNTYSASKKFSPEVILRGGKRLDYILFRSPTPCPFTLRASTCRVVLVDPVPSLRCSYSDHFGVESRLTFLPTASTISLAPASPLTSTELSSILSNLHLAYQSSLASSKFQLQLLGACIVLAVLLPIGASFQTLRYLGWVFVVAGTAAGAVGATMLYSGFVGGRWEAGALRNVMGEMRVELGRMESGREVRGGEGQIGLVG